MDPQGGIPVEKYVTALETRLGAEVARLTAELVRTQVLLNETLEKLESEGW